MKITFILNEQLVHVQADPGERLVNILREDFHLTGAKTGCLQGRCGSCTVLLDNKPVPSCIIPAFFVQNRRIETIEQYKLSVNFADIQQGFTAASLQMCGYCEAGKYFITESILQQTLQPDEHLITDMFSGNICKCTTINELINGVKKAAEIRRSRLYDTK